MKTGTRAISLAGCLLLAATPVLAVNGGSPDTSHAAVGFIFGSVGPAPCDTQVIGCSGVLISDTVFLTSAACADVFLHPEEYGYTLAAVWVSFDGSDATPCTGVSQVQSIHVNPVWDETSPDPIGNVGVMILSAPVSITPATLPAAGSLDTLPASQPYNVVAFGDDDGGINTSTNSAVFLRRYGTADFKSINAELIQLTAVQERLRWCSRPASNLLYSRSL